MKCEVRTKEINSQCAELLVRPLYNVTFKNRENFPEHNT